TDRALNLIDFELPFAFLRFHVVFIPVRVEIVDEREEHKDDHQTEADAEYPGELVFPHLAQERPETSPATPWNTYRPGRPRRRLFLLHQFVGRDTNLVRAGDA